jgi:hypothetical protein
MRIGSVEYLSGYNSKGYRSAGSKRVIVAPQNGAFRLESYPKATLGSVHDFSQEESFAWLVADHFRNVKKKQPAKKSARKK